MYDHQKYIYLVLLMYTTVFCIHVANQTENLLLYKDRYVCQGSKFPIAR